jgi:hypothetical protein
VLGLLTRRRFVMPGKAEAYKELVEKLSQSVAEAHARAPAEARSRIEQAYEEVVRKMGELLTIGADPTTQVWCNVGGVRFPATLAYCQLNACNPSDQHKPPKGGPGD